MRKYSKHTQKLTGIAFVILFAALGSYLLLFSHAATLTGDLNNDGTVNIVDLSIFLSHWQQSGSLPEDFNADNTVNIVDLSILLSHFGQTATASPPANTVLPAISGTATQGQTLTSTTGTWSNTPTSYTYQWEDCNSSGASCTNISGATSSTRVLSANDVTHTIRVVVTATNSAGSASATSAQSGVVASSGGGGTASNCAGTAGSGTVSQSALDACGLPSMNTTGPTAGTTLVNTNGFTVSGNCASLPTTVAAHCTGSGTSGSPYVIDSLNISGGVNINESNVILQNSVVTDVDVDQAAVKVASSATGVQINNDSIHGTNAVQSGSLAFAVSYFGNNIAGVTIDHTNQYNGDRILAGYGTVTNSYCLGGAHFNSSGGDLEHDECIYSDGSAPGIRAIHDTLINANPDQTAAIFIDNPDFGGGGVNGVVDVENSLLAGGGYCIYAGDSSGSHHHTGAVTITNNRFARLFYNTCGQFGPDAYVPSITTWSGNVWDDTNQAIGS